MPEPSALTTNDARLLLRAMFTLDPTGEGFPDPELNAAVGRLRVFAGARVREREPDDGEISTFEFDLTGSVEAPSLEEADLLIGRWVDERPRGFCGITLWNTSKVARENGGADGR